MSDGQKIKYIKAFGKSECFLYLLALYRAEPTGTEPKLDRFKHHGSHRGSRLDLGSAVETVSYSRGGVNFTRQAFTARGADVGVLRITADKPDAIAFVLSLNRKSNVEMRPEWEPVVKADGCDLVYDVRLHSGQEGSPSVT